MKKGPIWEWVLEQGGRINGEGEERGKWSMDFVYLYESRTMKPVEIIFSGNGREVVAGEVVRDNDGGDEPNQGTL
jgi:hypothetical protein